jgi:glycine cleavage system P protein (glycine dehydrogenase) subunit 2
MRGASSPPKTIPEKLRRKTPPRLPEVSEDDVLGHFLRLSQMNYCVDLGPYPLGSCTMKYNPRINEVIASIPELAYLHPWQDESTVQGILELLYNLQEWLQEITGTHSITLQPAAGAHGEWTGCHIIRASHSLHKEIERDEIIIPDSAHGTNPASASMCGYKVVEVPTGADGCLNPDALKKALSNHTAGLMMTNPNTLGLFEERILEVARLVHEAGGLLYYDGANLNGILGTVRPGDMGFDIVHLNLHKTFSTPHGGGGPGAGAVGVTSELADFLPVPIIEKDGERYFFNYNLKHTIGKVRGFYGNIGLLVRCAAYILALGAEGLKEAGDLSVLNTNYLIHLLKNVKGIELPYASGRPRKHEACFSLRRVHDETGVRALDVSKRLLDFGVHSPSNYFPLIVPEAFLTEMTDTESQEDIDRYAMILGKVLEEAYSAPDNLRSAPHNTSVGRLDDVKANHPKTMVLSWRMMMKRAEPSAVKSVQESPSQR